MHSRSALLGTVFVCFHGAMVDSAWKIRTFLRRGHVRTRTSRLGIFTHSAPVRNLKMGLREGVTFSQGPSAGSTRLELSFPKSIDMPMFLRRSFPENVGTCLSTTTQDVEFKAYKRTGWWENTNAFAGIAGAPFRDNQNSRSLQHV